jgi:hypothetical protein
VFSRWAGRHQQRCACYRYPVVCHAATD